MRIRWIENMSAEDALKAKDFLDRLSPSFDTQGVQGAEAPIELFLDSPAPFRFGTLVSLAGYEGREALLTHEGGASYLEVPAERERLVLSYDWRSLYAQIPTSTTDVVRNHLRAHPPQGNLYKQAIKRPLRLCAVRSGLDLIRELTHATWKWLSLVPQPPIPTPRFVVYLPLTFYPYLVEPAKLPHLNNIREEIAARLLVQVVLTKRLTAKEGVLITEADLGLALPITPVAFLGLDEAGQKRLYIYLVEGGSLRTKSTAKLIFSRSTRDSIGEKVCGSSLATGIALAMALPLTFELWGHLKPWVYRTLYWLGKRGGDLIAGLL